MKFLRSFLSAAFLLCLTAVPALAQKAAPPPTAQTAAAAAEDASSDLPPLIDRQKFFGDPQYSSAQISPDGQYLSFEKSYKGELNVWVKKTGAPFEDAHPITADTTRPVPGSFWTQDSKKILFVQDQGGNENYHVYAVDPQAEAVPETGVPPARDLTPYDSTRAQIISVPEATPHQITVGMNDRDPRVFDPYRVNIETGKRELILKNDQRVAGWMADLDGNLRLAVKQTSDGGTDILHVNEDGLGDVVYSCSFEESCSPVRFHKDGERVYMTTNKGSDADLTRLVLFNPDTKETEVVASDPKGEVDFGGAEFSDKTDELVATYYVGDRIRYVPKSEPFAEDLKTLREQLPDGDLRFGASTEDESRRIVYVSSDVDPGSAYLYDRETGETERLYRSRPDLPSEQLAEMKPLRYTARDGLTIHAYLTLPKGKAAEDLPVVVNPHGGPWSRDTWGYNPYVQFLANRGYAVLQPNFRGSTGYGQKFLNAGNDEWGDKMQNDITDGVQHLIDEGIADPERVGIFGGSYGGYATLAGAAFTPDLYHAAIAYAAPSNILTLLESIPPYWGPIKKIFDLRVGDPEKPEERKRLKRQSPLFSADRITAPLMVVQGANDPRVKQTESDQIVVALRERGFPVEYLVAQNEGHGFRSRENRMALAVAMETFLSEHLGGRYQQEAQPKIRRTLQGLTVDPATVTLPDSLEQAQARTAPLPEADGTLLEPSTRQYATNIKTQGREINVNVKRTVAQVSFEGQPAWRVVDRAQTAMGASVDSVLVDRQTLRTLHRSASQGGGTLRLRFTDDAVTGAMKARGQTFDIDKDLEAPALSDGVGLETFVAGLPLEEGYEATLRTFNSQKQQAVPMTLTVTGTASIGTPAGTFETYAVELTPTGGGDTRTLHVRREAPHVLVKKEQPLPTQMGGGTTTTVLQAMGGGGAGSGETGR